MNSLKLFAVLFFLFVTYDALACGSSDVACAQEAEKISVAHKKSVPSFGIVCTFLDIKSLHRITQVNHAWQLTPRQEIDGRYWRNFDESRREEEQGPFRFRLREGDRSTVARLHSQMGRALSANWTGFYHSRSAARTVCCRDVDLTALGGAMFSLNRFVEHGFGDEEWPDLKSVDLRPRKGLSRLNTDVAIFVHMSCRLLLQMLDPYAKPVVCLGEKENTFLDRSQIFYPARPLYSWGMNPISGMLRIIYIPIIKVGGTLACGTADACGAITGGTLATLSAPVAMACGKNGGAWIEDGIAFGHDCGLATGLGISLAPALVVYILEGQAMIFEAPFRRNT